MKPSAQAYFNQITNSSKVSEILTLLKMVCISRMDGFVSEEEEMRIVKAAESRLVLDCNVDLTPYTDREAQ